jgi:hypothetical protein
MYHGNPTPEKVTRASPAFEISASALEDAFAEPASAVKSTQLSENFYTVIGAHPLLASGKEQPR